MCASFTIFWKFWTAIRQKEDIVHSQKIMLFMNDKFLGWYIYNFLSSETLIAGKRMCKLKIRVFYCGGNICKETCATAMPNSVCLKLRCNTGPRKNIKDLSKGWTSNVLYDTCCYHFIFSRHTLIYWSIRSVVDLTIYPNCV